MIRLTLLLLVGLGAALLIAGRDLSPAEVAAMRNAPDRELRSATPAPQIRRADGAARLRAAEVAASGQPEGAADRAAPPPAAAAGTGIDAASQQAVIDAVQEALAQDLQETPDAAPPAADAASDGMAAVAEVADPVTPPVVASAPPPPAPAADEVAAAEPDVRFWYVTGDVVNVRGGPSTSFPVVGKVTYGEATEILADAGGGWVKIRLQSDGSEGYLMRRFLQDSEPSG